MVRALSELADRLIYLDLDRPLPRVLVLLSGRPKQDHVNDRFVHGPALPSRRKRTIRYIIEVLPRHVHLGERMLEQDLWRRLAIVTSFEPGTYGLHHRFKSERNDQDDHICDQKLQAKGRFFARVVLDLAGDQQDAGLVAKREYRSDDRSP